MAVRLEQPIKERPNLAPLAKPLLFLMVLISLNYAVFSFGYSKVSSQFAEISEKRDEINILEAKLDILSDLGTTILSANESLLLALSDKNPALLMLGQYGRLSDSTGVSLEDTSIGTKSDFDDEISKSLVSATIESDNPGDFLEFASNLMSYLPYNTIESISIKKSQDVYESVISTTIYWSAFPAVIGRAEDPVSELTSQELELMNEISLLNKPEFETLLPKEETSRLDPFN